LFVFQRRDCPRFLRVLDAERKRFELSYYEMNNAQFFDAEVASLKATCP